MINRLLTNLRRQFQRKPPDYLSDDPESGAITKELEKITTPIDTEDAGYSSPHIAVGYGLSPTTLVHSFLTAARMEKRVCRFMTAPSWGRMIFRV